MTRFEEEYLRHERDKAFEELEKKIGAKTIDIRTPIKEKRRWFVEKFGYCADDESVKMRWEERND